MAAPLLPPNVNPRTATTPTAVMARTTKRLCLWGQLPLKDGGSFYRRNEQLTSRVTDYPSAVSITNHVNPRPSLTKSDHAIRNCANCAAIRKLVKNITFHIFHIQKVGEGCFYNRVCRNQGRKRSETIIHGTIKGSRQMYNILLFR